ncbi:MAG TPA: hypothetical protein VGL59_14535 [Polyangia bacterium]
MSKLTIRHLVLAAAPLFVLACGNSSPPSNNGSGGMSGGSGGTSGGSGGASGTGGAGSGGAPATGGASGTGGTTVGGTGGADAGVTVDGGVVACATASATLPLISDFAGATAVADQAVGGTDVWTASPAGMATVTITGGEMHVASTGGSYASTSTLLSGTQPCVNVSAKYTGISFKIHSATETSLIFEILTPETKADSSGFRTTVTITPTATTVMVPFANLVKAPFGVGFTLPATYKPAEHAYAIAFGVIAMAEHMDVFLDDVTFY